MTITVSFILQGVCLITIGCFGIIGNILSAIVLFRSKSEKKSFRVLLIGLSFYDTLYIIMSLMLFGLPEVWIWYRNHIMMVLLPISYGLGHVARVGSVYVTVAVTLERYFAIVYPVRNFNCKSYFLTIISIFTVLYNIPKFFELRITHGTNGTRIEETELRKNEVYIKYYILWSKFIILEVIPYFIILFLNFNIVRTVRKSNLFRQTIMRQSRRPTERNRNSFRNTRSDSTSEESPKTSHKTAKPSRICHVLLWISIVFIICQSVKIIPDLYEVLYCQNNEVDCEQNKTMDAIISLSHLLLTINSSTNFIIYIMKGQSFKKEFLSIFKKSQPKNNRYVRNHTTYSRGLEEAVV
ncbi:FMRFamide receptor [Lepeophtheirus salmonis]|nr:FMRFamide receptor-like [Lepeophtheirus salmonis]